MARMILVVIDMQNDFMDVALEKMRSRQIQGI